MLKLAVLAVFAFSAATSMAQLDAATIIQRSVEANDRDWKAAPQFNYVERDTDDGHTNTYQVIMILGSPYKRLLAIDGHDLTPVQQTAQEHKLQATIARRSNETTQQRAQRIANYERDRKRDYQLMEQLTEAFNFHLEGRTRLGPYEVYELTARPRPGYQPPTRDTQVLTGMRGKLWVDTKSFQWVRVEAEVVHPVSIEGFVARVMPGTRFELEKAPVTDDIWLPTHFSMKAKAKIFFVFNHNSQEEDTYSNYHRAPPVEAAQIPPK